ncbi:MAG: hypothetical protein ACE5KY_01345 [Candidatus Tectimicrobiota bacterium]
MEELMAEAHTQPPDESAEERQRRADRLQAFYQRSREEPHPQATGATRPRLPSLTEVDPVLRSEFNTLSYLAIGFSLIALLLIAILFFRPPKPEAELRALTEAQVEARTRQDQLAGHLTMLNRRADTARQSELARSLRLTSIRLEALRTHGSPEVRAEVETLQARIAELVDEVERGPRTETPR